MSCLSQVYFTAAHFILWCGYIILHFIALKAIYLQSDWKIVKNWLRPNICKTYIGKNINFIENMNQELLTLFYIVLFTFPLLSKFCCNLLGLSASNTKVRLCCCFPHSFPSLLLLFTHKKVEQREPHSHQ